MSQPSPSGSPVNVGMPGASLEEQQYQAALAQMQAQLQEKDRQIAEISGKGNALLAQYNALQQSHAASQPVASSVVAAGRPSSSALKPPAIPRFAGQIGFECDRLLRAARLAAEFAGEANEQRIILLAGLHMEGGAALWFEAESKKGSFPDWRSFDVTGLVRSGYCVGVARVV